VRYVEDSSFIVAGTSAGAMAIPRIMLMEGETEEALLKGSVKISSGLGFIDDCIIDTHFGRRGRFGRLAQAIVINPLCTGIGLGEDTAILIKKGREAEVYGSGMVTIIDPKNVRHTNIAYADEGTPICIQNLRVHILCKGNRFILDTRKFIPAKEDLKVENEARMAVS
jgi:cyanophycinase